MKTAGSGLFEKFCFNCKYLPSPVVEELDDEHRA